MIPLLRVMQRVSLYYYTIITYYHVIITPGSIITHCYLFQSTNLQMYPRTVAHFLLAGPRGRAPIMSAKG